MTLLPLAVRRPAFLPTILMVRVNDQADGLPVAMLMHVSLTASAHAILAPAADGTVLLLHYAAFSLALWGLVALVTAWQG